VNELENAIIKYNNSQSQKFTELVNLYLTDNNFKRNPFIIGNTPISLQICGAKDYKLITTSTVIDKCLADKNNTNPEIKHPHDLPVNVILELPEMLRSPVLILKGSKENTFVAVTNKKDKDDNIIIISIKLGKRTRNTYINNILTSAYGKKNIENYIKMNIEKGNLIAYNNDKTDEFFLKFSSGLQLPTEGKSSALITVYPIPSKMSRV
jgi:hypothetical protein